MSIEIQNIHVEVEGKEIIKGVSLTFEAGKVHALMGPNGSGKSTLAKALMGHPKYVITQGKILIDGKEMTSSSVEERAKAGLFLSFQNPTEIVGVKIGHFLRTAVNAKRETPYSVVEFHKLLKEKMVELKIDPSFSRRYLNAGFSGGEKKRAEILQMVMLEPKYSVLDEPDSGTDVDALKVLSEGINIAKTKNHMGVVLITHYNRILKYVKPDVVTIIVNGKIVDSGSAKLAEEIESSGYEKYLND